MPRPARKVADRVGLALVDAGEDEALEAGAARVDHTERRVARARQRRRRFHDPLEHRIERELRADGDARVEQRAQAVGILEAHRRSF